MASELVTEIFIPEIKIEQEEFGCSHSSGVHNFETITESGAEVETHHPEKPLKTSNNGIRRPQSTKIQYQCYLCKWMMNLSTLRKHLEIHIGEKYKPFACSVCNFKFGRADKLKEHHRIHNGEKPFVCDHDQCPKRFRLKSALVIHQREHTGINLLQCEHCPRTFPSSFKKKAHLKIHFKEKSPKPKLREFKCRHCPKEYLHHSQLVLHERSHTGEQNFICCHCSKAFPSLGTLNAHERRHSAANQEKKFECNICHSKFAFKFRYNDHMRKHNNDVSYDCKSCSKTFRSSLSLREHENVHIGIKPHTCPHCPQAFYRKSNLVEHIRVHTGEMPFECPFCQRKFRAANSVWKHKKRMHLGEKINRNVEREKMLRKQRKSKTSDAAEPRKRRKKNLKDANSLFNKNIRDLEPAATIEVKSSSPLRESIVQESTPTPTLTPPTIKEQPDLRINPKTFDCDHCAFTCESNPQLIIDKKVHESKEKDENKYKTMEETTIQPIELHTVDTVNEVIDGAIEIKPEPISDEFDPIHIVSTEFKSDDLAAIKLPPSRLSSENRRKIYNKKEKHLECKICRKKFVLQYYLDNHMKTHNENVTYECDYCHQTFQKKTKLKYHMEMAHIENKRFQCRYCPKNFPVSNRLKLHEAVHLNDKPFQCSYCAQSFVSLGFLNAHEKKHTRSATENKYECNICQRKFALKFRLTRHMQVHTDESPYQCATCGKKLRSIASLREHENIHKGLKQHACTFCPQSYNNRSNLIEHIRIHTGEMPFECPFCQRKFRAANCLWKHKKRMHLGEKVNRNIEREKFLRKQKQKPKRCTKVEDQTKPT